MKCVRSARLALASVCPSTAVPQVGTNRCGWHFFVSSRNTEILPTVLGPRWVMGLFLPTVWLAEFPLPKIQMRDNIATKTWDAFVVEKVPTALLALFFGTWFPNLTSILSKSKMYVYGNRLSYDWLPHLFLASNHGRSLLITSPPLPPIPSTLHTIHKQYTTNEVLM